MAFSSALVLSDLNDYIAPSQACIKPVEIKKSDRDQGPSEIKVDHQGSYYEISKDGNEEKLETATISLNDCLACSGCVTSAESVLITMQSQEELYGVLEANKKAIVDQDQDAHRTIVISVSPQSRASLAAKYGITPLQVHRRLVTFFKHHLGAHHVVDSAFSRDLSLSESAREFVERHKSYMANGGEALEAIMQQQEADGQSKPSARRRREAARSQPGDNSESTATQSLPMLASSCPGWVCYAEKTHGAVLPNISTVRSPQQMMGVLIKDYFATKTNTLPNRIYHVSIMPCYDKKLEASRPDFFLEQYNTREVDCVLTTGEVDKMFQEQHVEFATLPESVVDDHFNKIAVDPETQVETSYGAAGSSSGGALEYILATAARELFGIHDVPDDPDVTRTARVVVKQGKNADVREYMLQSDDGRTLLRFATAYGFRNIQNIVRKIKSGKCSYHYIEVMACPGGCANGGGQLSPQAEAMDVSVSAKDWLAHVEHIYRTSPGIKPEENEVIKTIYSEWIGEDPTGERAARLLRTQYHAVTQNLSNPLATKW